MNYVDVATARGLSGARLALTSGVPGPWSEVAKYILGVKRIPFVAVKQDGGQANEALVAWTGHRNAPVLVYNDEPARARWDEILLLAERIQPEPGLVPRGSAERARMFGLAHEICSEGGLGWSRRLMMFEQAPDEDPRRTEALATMRRSYGVTPTTVRAAPARVADILGTLAAALEAQEKRGSAYFIGDGLTALDLYWAAFSALIKPLPEADCPMPALVRQWYGAIGPVVEAAVSPILLSHRDMIYSRHLTLPLDF